MGSRYLCSVVDLYIVTAMQKRYVSKMCFGKYFFARNNALKNGSKQLF